MPPAPGSGSEPPEATEQIAELPAEERAAAPGPELQPDLESVRREALPVITRRVNAALQKVHAEHSRFSRVPVQPFVPVTVELADTFGLTAPGRLLFTLHRDGKVKSGPFDTWGDNGYYEVGTGEVFLALNMSLTDGTRPFSPLPVAETEEEILKMPLRG